MKQWFGILLGGMLFFGGVNISSAQSYYHDSQEDITLKKSIIKGLLEGVNPDYLLTVENELWGTVDFYDGVEPFPHMESIMDETSGFRGVMDPITFDGDKIEQYTGHKISDIPGTSIMVFDGLVTKSVFDRTRSWEIIDGDKIWIDSGEPFSEVPKGSVIVYDCLFPPVFLCGKKVTSRAYNPQAFPAFGQTENYDPLWYRWKKSWHDFWMSPWYVIVGSILLMIFIGHILVTILWKRWR